MYIPASFQETVPAHLHAFVRRHSFATLVTYTESVPFATHLPLVLDTNQGVHGALLGHVARANPQWRHFRSGQEILAIFQGPHAFIPSTWYEQPTDTVPTWNYAAVHVYGVPRIMEETGQVFALLQQMMDLYQSEGGGMSLQPAAEQAVQLARAIVAFTLNVTRWEGKFKLNQNRSAEDQQRVRTNLARSDNPEDRALAGLMASRNQPDHPDP